MKLIFVYNANSGLWNGAMDVVHKVMSPSTYKCSLCKITYGPVRAKQSWIDFINDLPITCEFLHKDEFLKEWSTSEDLPAVFLQNEKKRIKLISSSQLKKMSLTDLQCKISFELENFAKKR